MPETVTRGDLPHWYLPGHAHFVTYRIVGSLPIRLLRELRVERERQQTCDPPPGVTESEHRLKMHRRFFREYERYLDKSLGRAWLRDECVAAIVRENLYHHNGSKYQLLAYCVMPNHVHVLLQPFEGAATSRRTTEAGSFGHVGQAASLPSDSEQNARSSTEASSFGYGAGDEIPDGDSPLTSIMHCLKSYTANRANEVVGHSGQFWQHESYDHWVRDVEELERIANYIAWNPVRARLCARPIDWQFSSAYDRYQSDGSDCALVGWLRDDWGNPK